MLVHEQVKVVSELKPDILDGYSGSLFLLAKMLNETGLSTVHQG